MVPIIISFSSPQQLRQHLKTNYRHWTLTYQVESQKNSISLQQIKQFINHLQLCPGVNEKHLLIIQLGHLMSLPAQNCLLKALEETRPQQQILITTNRPYLLLPTIISRCQTNRLSLKKITPVTNKLNPPLKDWSSQPDKIINLTDKIIKTDPQAYFSTCLNLLLQNSQKKSRPQRHQIINALLACTNDLEKNINPKLAIDHFFFSIGHYLKSTAEDEIRQRGV